MPKGGARLNSGPAPDPNALRRDRPSDAAGWTTLPANGRGDAPVPAWPLLPDVGLRAKRDVTNDTIERLVCMVEEYEAKGRDTARLEDRVERLQERVKVLDFQIAEQDDRERSLWVELWGYPQSVIWDRDRQHRAVAMFVRHQVLGELGSLDDAKEARQWSDRLGVNPTAMLRNRWRIASDEVGERRTSRPQAVRGSRSASSRDRLTAIAE